MTLPAANGEVALDDLLLTGSFRVLAFNPWSPPELVGDDVGRAGRDGMILGRDLRRIRRVPLQVLVDGDSRADAVDRLAELTATSGATVLRWWESGRRYRLEGRVRLVDPDSSWIGDGAFLVGVRFEAGEPRILDDDEQSASTGFPEAGEGREYPLEFPRVYGAPGSGGVLRLDNAGTAPAPWRAEVVGPWVNPTIRDVATGDELRLSISLGSGEVLVLESTGEQIALGSAHRLNTVLPGSVWPSIAPGGSEWRVTGTSGSGSVTVWWREAWR